MLPEALSLFQSDRGDMEKRRWLSLYFLQGTVIVMFCAFPFVFGGATKLFGDYWFMPVLLAYGALWLNQGRLLVNWRCPRCRRSFLRRDKSTAPLLLTTACPPSAKARAALGWRRNVKP